jgi:hypothetical protein
MDKVKNPTQEWWFSQWIVEAIKYGYVEKFIPEDKMPKWELFSGYSRTWEEEKIVFKGSKREEKRILTHELMLLRPSSYGSDGAIIWTDKAFNVLFADLEGPIGHLQECYFKAQKKANKYITIVDVKAPTGTNRNSDTPFQFTRKWLWQKHHIYVNKVMNIPPKKKSGKVPKGYLFNETWTPARYLVTDGLTKNRDINSYNPIIVQEFLLL